jgi:5-methyltetrahydrofolate--homocysteine methyltransferase
LLDARAVVGFWPANGKEEQILLYTDPDRSQLAATLHMQRQQFKKSSRSPNRCLSDYVAPVESGVTDYVGAFAVTTGHGVAALAAQYAAQHDDYSAIMAQALADRLAEAFAERLHEVVRTELWGYAPGEQLENDALVREEYQGIRPAPGYPACPVHAQKDALFQLLEAPERVGMTLTESHAMLPAASVSGWYFWRPEAAYFGVGEVGAEQRAEGSIVTVSAVAPDGARA